MNFAEAIKSGFDNYINFNGRASRSENNYFFLFVIIISFFAEILDPADDYTGTGGTLSMISGLMFLLPNISMTIRRLHDLNKSGWNYLWALTIIGIFPVIYWMYFKVGDNYSNAYGDNPLLFSNFKNDEQNKVFEETPNELTSTNIEEKLKNFKKMLDDGLINQEDYDTKKKELLGL